MGKRCYAVSDDTKKALAAALKQLMAQKSLDKITVAELAALCGMRRQNFYYHFSDIHSLLHWMFEEEAVSLLERHEGALLWQDGLLQFFQYLEENRAVCCCALKSLGHDHIRRFFETDIYAVIHRTVEQIGREIGASGQKSVDTELLTRFYVAALAGVAESWVLGEISRSPEELVECADRLLRDHVCGAALRLTRAEENKRRPIR